MAAFARSIPWSTVGMSRQQEVGFAVGSAALLGDATAPYPCVYTMWRFTHDWTREVGAVELAGRDQDLRVLSSTR